MTDTPTPTPTPDRAALMAEITAVLERAGLVSPLLIPATGQIPDVVDGQIIESAWGNTISDRTVTPFDTVAAMTAAVGPINGSLAVTLDTGQVWLRVAGAWRLHGAYAAGTTTWGAVVGGVALTAIGASVIVASLDLGTVPFKRLVYMAANLRIDNETAAAGLMGCRLEAVGAIQSQSLAQYPATAAYVNTFNPCKLFTLPAATAAQINLVAFRQSGTCTGKTYADATFNSLNAIAVAAA